MKYLARLYSEYDKLTLEEVVEAKNLGEAIKKAISLVAVGNETAYQRDFSVRAVTRIVESN